MVTLSLKEEEKPRTIMGNSYPGHGRKRSLTRLKELK
jgi:hypothetical protein